MKTTPLWLTACLGLCVANLHATDLTPENMEKLLARLKSLKENLENHISTRNSGAGQQFLTAASDPKAAIELYLKCVKTVDYDREGRPEADFRAWEQNQSDRLRDPKFIESLQIQLRYLALSCQAAEAEDLSSVFSSLVSHVDSLSQLTEMPTGPITQAVGGSVFAKAFYLESLLGKAEEWEPVPINIAGIYDTTILPHLRKKDPAALMNAWDRRIEQPTRLVTLLEEKKQDEMRGMNKDEERRARNAQANERGAVRAHSEEEFKRRTLPQLQWGKLKDMFLYVDQTAGAAAMLQFIEANYTHELGEQFFREFEDLITRSMSPGAQQTVPGTN